MRGEGGGGPGKGVPRIVSGCSTHGGHSRLWRHRCYWWRHYRTAPNERSIDVHVTRVGRVTPYLLNPSWPLACTLSPVSCCIYARMWKLEPYILLCIYIFVSSHEFAAVMVSRRSLLQNWPIFWMWKPVGPYFVVFVPLTNLLMISPSEIDVSFGRSAGLLQEQWVAGSFFFFLSLLPIFNPWTMCCFAYLLLWWIC